MRGEEEGRAGEGGEKREGEKEGEEDDSGVGLVMSKRGALTAIIRISPKQMPEHIRIPRRVAGPHLPQRVAHRIGNKFILGPLLQRIGTHVRRLRVRILAGVEFLCGQEAEMLAPEHAAKRGGVMAGFEGLPVHGAFEHVVVFHDD